MLRPSTNGEAVRHLSGDGLPDFLAGDTCAGSNAGRVEIFTLGCPASQSYCVTSPSSASAVGARIGHTGSASVAANDLRLFATDCPPNQFALFFYGTDPVQVPVGDGVLCVGGTQYRLYPAAPTAPGTPTHNLDLTAPPSAAGQIGTFETWYFQCWYRDPATGGSGFNFSDGLRVRFCP